MHNKHNHRIWDIYSRKMLFTNCFELLKGDLNLNDLNLDPESNFFQLYL